MDVTSLLNVNSVAAEQHRKAEKVESSKTTPTRNRTPWDAGGYSLPINTVSSITQTTAPLSAKSSPRRETQVESTVSSNSPLRTQRDLHVASPSAHSPQGGLHDDSHTSASTPSSPNHKFSDSRSSLSSFTSSLNSTTHSRFSSLSTTTSGSFLFNNLAQTISESGIKTHEFDFQPATMDSSDPPAFRLTQGSLSPTQSLDALALVAGNRMADHQSTASPPRANVASQHESQKSLDNNEPAGGSRSSSPSDVIMHKRPSISTHTSTALPSLRIITGESSLNGSAPSQMHNIFLSAPIDQEDRSLPRSSGHKRAVSAPSFGPRSITNTAMAEPSTTKPGPRGEPTPPTSQHPDNQSPTEPESAYPNPHTPPMSHADILNQAVKCLYIADCDTGSQLRKAISHIFGRNKMCTRLIPLHVWVHYCRKHYQRSRYRNPKEYAKLQCALVSQQISRVHEWSQHNMQNGLPGVVQDWGLAVRKREQKRLDDLGNSRKRTAASFDQDSDDGENDDDDNNGRPMAVPATAVPAWLLELCGKGYSTATILEIFQRLHEEILNNILPCFPDIEILPNILVDQDEPKSPKGYTKRATSTHKRAASLGVMPRTSYQTHGRQMSQPISANGFVSNSQSGEAYDSPLQKRRRANEMSENSSPIHGPASHSGRLGRSVDFGRRMQPHSSRSSFPIIEEHRGAEHGNHVGYGTYTSQTPSYYPPLPAPTPTRHNGSSMAAHLENHNMPSSARRPVHQRSVSSPYNEYTTQRDMASSGRGPYNGYVPPRNNYGHDGNYYVAPPRMQEYQQTSQYGAPTTAWSPAQGAYTDMRQSTGMAALGHHRGHSSSMAQSSYTPVMPTVREQSGQTSFSGNSAFKNHSPSSEPRNNESSEECNQYSSRR